MSSDFFRVVPRKRTVKIRKSSGIIFNNPPLVKRIVFYFGTTLIVAALGYLVYLYYPLAEAVIGYYSHKSQPVEVVVPTKEEVIEVRPTPIVLENFTIEIPKIRPKSNVVTNVPTSDESVYEKVLQNSGVAHALGSAIPGSGKGTNVYIFAHSTELGLNMVRKNSAFYLLNQLVDGDQIAVDYGDKRLVYNVFDKKIADSKDVQYLYYSDANNETIILQTCWPLGTNWNRLLVFGERVE